MLEFLLFPPTVGAVLVLVSLFGYLSNWLNGKFLNTGLTRLLYYVGAFVHETSHALVCVFTGAGIIEYKVFAKQPRVVYTNPKAPFVSNTLISFAPVFGGLLFLFLLNRYLLIEQFTTPELHTWEDMLTVASALFSQMHLFTWQSLVFLLLFLNIGAMLGPSIRDLKNIWPALLFLLLLKTPFIVSLGLAALMLILVGIGIQITIIVLLQFARYFSKLVNGSGGES